MRRTTTLNLDGWKARKIGDVHFFQCPYCGHCSERVYVNHDGITVECYKCKKRFDKDKLKSIALKKPIVVCKSCEMEVSLTSENLELIGGYSYMCPQCWNTVAIKFKNYTLKPQTVMNLKWNKEIRNKAIKLDDGIFFQTCNSKKDFLILRIMQLMAKTEGTGFRYTKLDEKQKAGIFFDVEQNKYLGFIGWTEDEKATLRQIFTIKDERLKGYGTKFLKFWAESFADNISNKFIVEFPNAVSQKMLLRLGYAKNNGEYIKGIKCSFVRH